MKIYVEVTEDDGKRHGLEFDDVNQMGFIMVQDERLRTMAFIGKAIHKQLTESKLIHHTKRTDG